MNNATVFILIVSGVTLVTIGAKGIYNAIKKR